MHALVAIGSVSDVVVAALVADIAFFGGVALIHLGALLLDALVALGSVLDVVSTACTAHIARLRRVALMLTCRSRRSRARAGARRWRRSGRWPWVVAREALGQQLVLPAVGTVRVAGVGRRRLALPAVPS